MKRITTRITLAAAVLAVAGALVAPAGAEAATDGEAPRRAAAAGHREATAAQHGGLDRTDAAVALAILAGVCAMALRGDAVIGSMVAVTAAALGAATRPL